MRNFYKKNTPKASYRSLRHSVTPSLFGRFSLLLVTGCWLLVAPTAQAQGSLALTVTPPLFNLSIGPGDTWSSSLKLVNTNAYDMTLYATVMDFAPQGEAGQGRFVPLPNSAEESGSRTLAHWITLPQEPVFVPREQSADVPFTVRIPLDADPGGHYAAILVGTQPVAGAADGPQIKIASYVSSLLFVRVGGEIVEEAFIREFITEKDRYEKPDAIFSLRFENTGNVHLQPQGDITITNMWGKTRGVIPINQKSNFGNVLPNSIRKFTFEWQGEESIFEAGKYRAVATIGYGRNGRQNLSATTYFWVVPLKPVGGIAAVLAAMAVIMIVAVRRYVRKVLELEAAAHGLRLRAPMPAAPAPSLGYTAHEKFAVILRFWKFPRYAWRYLLVLVFGLGIAGLFAAIYFKQALIPSRQYQVLIHEEGGDPVRIRGN